MTLPPVDTPDPTPLPRGPHGLSRHQVEQSQRDRLLLATADAVAEKGYAATSVADILRRAGVSRTTFYQLFDDKADCFLAACRMASDFVAGVMAHQLVEDSGLDTGGPEATPLDRLDHLLAAYLETIAASPTLARVFLVEVYAAGPAAIAQRRAALDAFVDLVVSTHDGRPGLIGSEPEQRFAAEMLVGAVSSVVTNAVAVGETADLVELHQPMMQMAAQMLGDA